MPDLEPITRDEKLWSGEDLEPITRREMYIKHLYDETQVIPDKPITREEMFILKAGEELHDVTIEQLNVSENGTYSESGKAYSPVIVDVPLPENAYLLKDFENVPSDIVTFNDGSALPMPSLKVGIEPIQSGSGDPSPSNVRPISGWDEANVSDVGANLIDITSMTPTYALNGITYTINSDGSVTANGTATARSQVYWSIPQNTAKTLANKKLSGGSSQSGCSLFLELNESPYTNYATDTGEGATISSDIANATTTVNYVFRIAQGTTVNNLTITPRITDEMKTYTIDLDGTRYGGEVDVVNGVLTVDRATITYDGSNDESWVDNMFQYGYSIDKGSFKSNIEGKSNYLKYSFGGTSDGSYYIGTSYLNVRIDSIASLADFKTYLSSNPLQICSELATPITIQLTPTAIKSIEGSNNVWGDCGQILEGEYFSKEA